MTVEVGWEGWSLEVRWERHRDQGGGPSEVQARESGGLDHTGPSEMWEALNAESVQNMEPL